MKEGREGGREERTFYAAASKIRPCRQGMKEGRKVRTVITEGRKEGSKEGWL
jgi:hypothetical protein